MLGVNLKNIPLDSRCEVNLWCHVIEYSLHDLIKYINALAFRSQLARQGVLKRKTFKNGKRLSMKYTIMSPMRRRYLNNAFAFIFQPSLEMKYGLTNDEIFEIAGSDADAIRTGIKKKLKEKLTPDGYQLFQGALKELEVSCGCL